MNNQVTEITEKIKCWGIVQGVGFRPFVVRLADHFGLKGQVLNVGGLVEIQLTDTVENIDRFIDALKKEKPEPAEIVHIKREQMAFKPFEGFTILVSGEGDDEAALIPADLSICPECLKELKNPENPRFNHPFISCMVCGPRYTIIDKIPYDRENTAMLEFPMCEFCHSEYSDRLDRRFHAQPNACPDCGPHLFITDRDGNRVISGDEGSLKFTRENLKNGKIFAVKGLGGFHLCCDAKNADAIKELRKRKK
ncbi:MAG: carbamoyltransferase HypF, partial [Clostridiales bacterium]|nr:carbamoyltransferase HypF [Clostridiales bacterium]